MLNNIEPFDPYMDYGEFDEFHSVNTIQLGELVHDGLIDFKDGTWDKQLNGMPIQWHSEEQKERFYDKFQQYYYYREIGELPFKRWKGDLLSKIALLMPKYCLAYEALEKNPDPLQNSDTYGKSRTIYSDFPQTMLSENEDYASTGNDNQFERVQQGDFVEKMNALMNDYNDVDYALIRELDSHFYCLLTSNMNGY